MRRWLIPIAAFVLLSAAALDREERLEASGSPDAARQDREGCLEARGYPDAARQDREERLEASGSPDAARQVAQKAEEKRRTLLENEKVRVREVKMEPGIDYAEHTHRYPHVGVIVQGGKLEFREKGKVEAVEFKAGDAGWREAGVTHSIRNVGKTAVHVVEVELK